MHCGHEVIIFTLSVNQTVDVFKLGIHAVKVIL